MIEQKNSHRPSPITDDERRAELAAYARDLDVIAGVEHLRFFPLAIESGRGATLRTPAGRELIDFSASWTATGLGNGHPAIADAIARAASTMAGASVLSASTTAATALATRLATLVNVTGEARVYLGLAGTDANDVAVRGARHATGRERIVGFTGSYHGGLGLAQRVSGVGLPEGTDAPDATLLPFPRTADDLAQLETALRATMRAGDVAAVIVEAVQCDGGVLVPPDGFLRLLRDACDEHGARLIVDEVKAGLARTGHFLAHHHEASVVPDAVTLAKSLGGGLPVSAVVATRDMLDAPVASALLTTAGAAVPCAAAHAALGLLADGELAARAVRLGEHLVGSLRAYAASDRPGAVHVLDVRGRGLLIGLELDAAAIAAKTVYRAWELGVVAYVVRDNVIELTPPLTIHEDELSRGIDRLLFALDNVAEGAVPDDAIAAFAGW